MDGWNIRGSALVLIRHGRIVKKDETMKKLLAIGEALIDFIPSESGRALKDVAAFAPAVGGAPANVCGAFAKLGGRAAMITQLGADPFGDKIEERLDAAGIDCGYIRRTEEANTSLAFVALQENGNREFSFYRKPGADMLLPAEEIKEEWFQDAFCLHFCSVSLGDFPMKEAHKKAIEYALKNHALISFDPNIRLALWESPGALKKAVLEFLPMAHILKISDEEVEFITGAKTIEEALPQLFTGNVQLIVYTKGPDGAQAYLRNGLSARTDGIQVKAVDTTGAGDGFIGAFLYRLYSYQASRPSHQVSHQVGLQKSQEMAETLFETLTTEDLTGFLSYANRFSAYSVQKKGAIASYPTAQDMIE